MRVLVVNILFVKILLKIKLGVFLRSKKLCHQLFNSFLVSKLWWKYESKGEENLKISRFESEFDISIAKILHREMYLWWYVRGSLIVLYL
jgi:hypothetical protein